MQNVPNNKNYIPPQSPCKRSIWVDAISIIYKVAFFIIIVIGFWLCMSLCYNGEMMLGLIVFTVSILIAVLTVGFVIVFLDLAKDIRDIASYVYVIGAMMIEDKNLKSAISTESTEENTYDKINIKS